MLNLKEICRHSHSYSLVTNHVTRSESELCSTVITEKYRLLCLRSSIFSFSGRRRRFVEGLASRVNNSLTRFSPAPPAMPMRKMYTKDDQYRERNLVLHGEVFKASPGWFIIVSLSSSCPVGSNYQLLKTFIAVLSLLNVLRWVPVITEAVSEH